MMISKIRAVLLVFAALAAQAAWAAADSLQKVRESGVLQFAVYDNFPPFSYKEGGRPKGLDIDIARALAQRLGVVGAPRVVGADENMEDDLRNNVWKGHYLGGGVADLMMHVPVDPEFQRRNDRVSIVAPYYSEQIVVAVDRELAGPDFDLEVFTQHKVGVELDTLSDFYLLSALQGRMRPNVVHFSSVGEAAAALKRGEIRGIMGPRSEVESGIRGAEASFAVGPARMPGLRRSTWDVGLALKAGNEDLARAVRDAMRQLHNEGELARLFADYGLTYREPTVIER